MDTVILFSFFNSNNIGDKAISETFLKNLSEKFKVIRCSNEGDFNVYNKYVGENLGIFERVKRKLLILCGKNYFSPRYKKFMKQYEEYLKDCKAVVIGGGNILMDYSEKTNSHKKLNEYIKIANEKGRKCYALSVGIGPFATEKQLENAVKTLEGCEYVSFRDKASYDLFIKGGGNPEKAKISIDPVFTLPYDGTKRKSDNIIAVNIVKPSWYGESYQEKTIDDYSRFIGFLAKRYPEKDIVLFSTETNDNEGMNRVFDANKNEKNVSLRQIGSIDELRDFYSRCSLVIGARMHSLIIAYSCRIPVTGLSWTSKVSEFFRIIGKPHRYVDLKALGGSFEKICKISEAEEDWDFDLLIKKAEELLKKDLEEIA
ncbi:MAG: polysaccharide pyruvyl transferase family protein [Oscillospiraceae bacterium]|nr:polysaccharide pyruvyl transferase family protein [Oscillospiraceae bacterium]